MLVIRSGVLGGVFLVVGCGSSSSSSSTPSLYQTWEVFNSATGEGQGLTFDSNGNYVHEVLQELTVNGTLSNNLETEIETGTFVLNGTGSMTLTPVQWTCSGTYAPYAATYTFSGGALLFSVSGTLLDLSVDTTPASQANGVQLTEGCFESSGFVQQALAPVSQ
ncbi:MAG TPA: hypothetical protein VEK07_12985 [Polyangiaceae bacterium]|nr:hypothetical protein [Polyangiaceae bacterium]